MKPDAKAMLMSVDEFMDAVTPHKTSVPPITVIITSCGRQDLLRRTIESFFKLNTYPVTHLIIHEDHSGELEKTEFSIPDVQVSVIVATERIGLSASIDRLMQVAHTEYVFHCEDDWLFEGNADFMADSLAILEERRDIHQVWIRAESDHGHPLLPEVHTARGVAYKELSRGFLGDWSGFSWNPGLRRVSDYKKMFPDGYAAFGDEIVCSRHANTFGYKAASLVHSACRHIGWDRHTPDFKV